MMFLGIPVVPREIGKKTQLYSIVRNLLLSLYHLAHFDSLNSSPPLTLTPIPMSGIDRISTLPDAVICHILSFLPTKLAAATSILSKRWTPLWLSLLNLDFDEHDERRHLHFSQMVSQAILRRDPTLPVKTFSLVCCPDSLCQPSHVAAWVEATVRRGLQFLQLRLHSGISLRSNVLASATLVALKLTDLTLNDAFSAGTFPNLKTLYLKLVHFEKPEYLMRLVSACPILEDLFACGSTVNGKWINDGDIDPDAEFRTLHKLVRACVSDNCVPLKCIYKVKSLIMHEKFSHYKVNRTFSNLTFLGLIFMVYDWDCFIEVLQHCPKLQTLLIVKYADRNPDDKKWVQRSQPVPKCLTSHLKKFTLKNFRGWECELQFAKYILQNAKVLRSMRICSVAFSNAEAKFELIRKLSLCPRSSETCKLSFE